MVFEKSNRISEGVGFGLGGVPPLFVASSLDLAPSKLATPREGRRKILNQGGRREKVEEVAAKQGEGKLGPATKRGVEEERES